MLWERARAIIFEGVGFRRRNLQQAMKHLSPKSSQLKALKIAGTCTGQLDTAYQPMVFGCFLVSKIRSFGDLKSLVFGI